MGIVLTGLSWVAGLAALVCYIIIIVRMFQNGDTTLGIIGLVGLICCIGYVITYVMGWVNSTKYRSMPIMPIWTACFIVAVICGLVSGAFTQQ